MATDNPNVLVAGTCRFCGCREHTPCEGGCAWTDDTQTLCTTCLAAVAVLQVLVPALGVFAATPKHGIHLATARWDALAIAEQRGLVLQVRTWLDQVQEHLAAELGEQAVFYAQEIDAIQAFLLEHAADLAKPQETISELVIRLLAPHVGSRIISPAGAGL